MGNLRAGQGDSYRLGQHGTIIPASMSRRTPQPNGDPAQLPANWRGTALDSGSSFD
jgi:hypothetical protein